MSSHRERSAEWIFSKSLGDASIKNFGAQHAGYHILEAYKWRLLLFILGASYLLHDLPSLETLGSTEMQNFRLVGNSK
jgi:hypothetical protein